MIDKLLQHHAVRELQPGFVAEFHQTSDSVRPGFIHTQTIDDFIEDWGYAILGRCWNEPVADDELPTLDPETAYLAVVHPEGAFVVAVDAVGVRQ